MGESGILIDAHERPLSPVIAWHDDRDDAEVADLAEPRAGGVRRRRRQAPARPVLPHQAPLATGARLESRSATTRFDVAGWVVRRLGGDAVIEMSLAGRTGWLDVAKRDWWDEALAWSGAGRGLMPPLVQAGAPVGTVTSEAVSPLLRGALLTLAGHDHQAAALGARAVDPVTSWIRRARRRRLCARCPRAGRADMARLAAAASRPTRASSRATGACSADRGRPRAAPLLELLGVDEDALARLDAAAERAPGEGGRPAFAPRRSPSAESPAGSALGKSGRPWSPPPPTRRSSCTARWTTSSGPPSASSSPAAGGTAQK